jgi:hypothetical protein
MWRAFEAQAGALLCVLQLRQRTLPTGTSSEMLQLNLT